MKCPVCESLQSRVLAEISLADVLEQIDRTYETDFLDKLDLSDRSVTLRRCRDCELDYFDPPIEGSADFYSQLGAVGWVQEARWDHLQVLDHLAPAGRIIDLGAGNQTFAQAAQERGLEVISIDFAENSTERNGVGCGGPISANLTRQTDREELAQLLGASAEVVTAFHVLEHLAQPRTLLELMKQLLRPGGLGILSVPNRYRFDISPNQALDCPPHHETRWGAAQLRTFGLIAGATSVDIKRELRRNPKQIVGGPIKWAIDKTRSHSPDFGPVGRPWPLWRVLFGHSVMAIYRFD